MAAELVVAPLLAASLEGLFKLMTSPEVLNFFQKRQNNNELLEKMRLKLLLAEEVLNDAEKKQIEKPNVKKWIDELQAVIYMAQDVMDSINTEALERKVECESASYKVWKCTPITNGKVLERTEAILKLLEYILNEKDRLRLGSGVQNMLLPRAPATSLLEGSGVYGSNSEKEDIIKSLLSDEISAIPIVGMGGVGKTTLAQLIYNDDRVQKYFDKMAWVFVSEKFDILKITKHTAEEVTEETYEGDNLNRLQVELKKNLTGKKFLLVLDDVWNESYETWVAFKKPFESVACGSKIIVTTRNEGVASVMRNVQSHQLKTLSGDDCWQLFVEHVDLPSLDQELEEIGKKIVQKCQGLPLAIKSFGGLLRRQQNPVEWVKILNSNLWEFPKEKSSIHPVLWRSYHYLPAHLKRCFSYCSMFPKNHEIDRDELIKLWMAEDLIQPASGMKIEEVGKEYFHELLSRSLFQQLRGWDGSIYFGMHNLVNDLATFTSGELCLRWDEGDCVKPSRKIHHLSHFGACGDRDTQKYQDLLRDNCKHLRTVFFSPCSQGTDFYRFVVKENLLTLSSLRVLSLCNFKILKLPDSIGNLKSLRYLDLSSTQIKELPDTVCTLYNLQTLLLRKCSKLKGLPIEMAKLINLRLLDLSDTKNVDRMPFGVGNLKDLVILSSSG